MASVVDTTVKNFNSTMSGAPSLPGVSGALVSLFDAVLVNGFDVKTATGLTVAGGVASMPFSGSHSAQLDTVISIAGITGTYASLNGEQKVTAVAAGVVRFATSLPDGAASGTITFKMAPAGWEKVYSGTSKAVYRSLDPASTKMLLRVDDTGAQVARVVGYEAMSDVDTGVGVFPTAAQIAGGGYWSKSTQASSAAVGWNLVADSRTFYLSVRAGMADGVNNQMAPLRGFGDAIALRPSGDAYSAFLGYGTSSSPAVADGCLGNNASVQVASPRAYTGLGSGVTQSAQIWGLGNQIAHYSGVTDIHGAFPNPVDGALYLSKKLLSQGGNTSPRSELPGLYALTQSGAWGTFKAGDKVPGSGPLAGRTLVAVTCFGSGSMASSSNQFNTGVVMLDVTGPWR